MAASPLRVASQVVASRPPTNGGGGGAASGLSLDDGLEPALLELLAREQIADAFAIEALDATDWARLYAEGLTLGQKLQLKQVVSAKLDVPFGMPSASGRFNVLAILFGIGFASPALVIGMLHEFVPGLSGADPLSYGTRVLGVLVPGAVYLAAMMLTIETNRTRFSTDVLEQRSEGVSVREAERANLTNTAVVSALLLTVIVAMLQVEPPLAETHALLSQWYSAFLLAATVPCFVGTVLSSMLLLYIEPLDDRAANNFVGTFADYVGEPAFAVVFGIVNFAPALSLWLWGVYGMHIGLLACIACGWIMRRITLATMYMGRWVNPTVGEAEQRRRKQETKMMIAASGVNFEETRSPARARALAAHAAAAGIAAESQQLQQQQQWSSSATDSVAAANPPQSSLS